MNKFSLDINLDDETEVNEFIAKYNTMQGRALANRLGIKGKGSARLASDLSCYAWNKFTAIKCRLAGKIVIAQSYEAICDDIYKRGIQPICECW